MDEFHSSGAMVSAPKYDMLLHVTVDSRLKSDGWVVGTRAYGDIIYSRTEMVQVVCVETVCNCEAEEGGSDKSILHSYRIFSHITCLGGVSSLRRLGCPLLGVSAISCPLLGVSAISIWVLHCSA